MRFLDGVRVLEAEGVRASLELGPDGILTALAAGCLSEASTLQAVAAQRRGRDGSEALLAALGVLHVHGVGIDWEKVAGSSARQVRLLALPTYAFQRQRYWLEAEKASGDVATMGLSDAAHPLLGAATPLAESDGFLLTGRLSLTEAGWLRDHAVFGTVLLPGTGLLELGFAAARAVGLSVGIAADAAGAAGAAGGGGGSASGSAGWRRRRAARMAARALSIYSRAEDAPEGASWTLHAQGVLGGRRKQARSDAGGDGARGVAACGWAARST